MDFAVREGERLDDLERNGYHIIQDPARFCFGVDAVFLSGFVRMKRGARCIDLGTGTGILPILLSAKTAASHFVGLEIQSESADMARRSVAGNHLTDKIEIIEGDLREAAEMFGSASFDAVVTNPPYVKAGALSSDNEAKRIARQEILCNLRDVLDAAEKLLKSSGLFFMVHRPERLTEILVEMHARGLEPKRLRFVAPYLDREPNLVLIEGKKGAASGIKVERPLIIYEDDGSYRQEIRDDYGF